MSEYGYYIEDTVLICPQCASKEQDKSLLTIAQRQGYPDGYTCDECNITVEGDEE